MNLPSFAVGLGEVAFGDRLEIPPFFVVSSVVEAGSTDLRSHSDSSTNDKVEKA
jgi:hypothetical protein